MLQLRVFFISAVSTFCCVVGGEDVKCICSAGHEPYIASMTQGTTIYAQETTSVKIGNQIIERLDSILSTIKQEKTIHDKNTGIESVDKLEKLDELKQLLNLTVENQYNYPTSCSEATANSRRSGVYSIKANNFASQPFQVSCDEDLHGGGWTVVLRRKDGSVDFFREWPEYKQGFGNLEGEFFIGLDRLHALTNGPHTQEVIFVMEDFDNVRKYAKYSSFAIGNETERYVLKTLGKYSGDAGDSFTNHAGQPFKTKEIPDPPHNCAVKYTGAWWYKACHSSNLCGTYLKGAYGQEKFAQGVVWYAWRGHNYSLKFAQMMIRPQRL